MIYLILLLVILGIAASSSYFKVTTTPINVTFILTFKLRFSYLSGLFIMFRLSRFRLKFAPGHRSFVSQFMSLVNFNSKYLISFLKLPFIYIYVLLFVNLRGCMVHICQSVAFHLFLESVDSSHALMFVH